jgi:hypothetical protein
MRPGVLLRRADPPGRAGVSVEQRLDPGADRVLRQVVAPELDERRSGCGGVAGHLQPEAVGGGLLGAGEGGDRRVAQEEEQVEDQEQQRQRGGFGHRADAQRRAALDDPPRDPIHEEDAGRDRERHEGDEVPDVVQDVVPHLVPHDEADLPRREAFQDGVVQDDPLGAQEAGHVGVVVLGLPAGVDLVHLVGRDPLGVGQVQDLLPQPGVLERLGFVEQRVDEDRGDRHHEDQEQDAERRPRHPPTAPQAADDDVEQGQEERLQHHPDGQRLPLVAQPGGEGLVREAVPLLPHEAPVGRQREQADERHDGEQGDVGHHLEVATGGDLLGQTLHGGGQAARDDQRQKGDLPQGLREEQGISAVGVRLHARIVRGHARERILNQRGRGGGLVRPGRCRGRESDEGDQEQGRYLRLHRAPPVAVCPTIRSAIREIGIDPNDSRRSWNSCAV